LFQQTPGFTLEQRRTSLVPQEQALSGMTTLNLEDRVRQEMDMRYRTKLEELEQKSVMLDRSLQVVEEMREKFSSYE
jgi:non-homologous end joining protein Ku